MWGYALATMMTKGFAAEETKATLARAWGALPGAVRTPEYWTLFVTAASTRTDATAINAPRAPARRPFSLEAVGSRSAGPRRLRAADASVSFSSWPAISSCARADLERALADYEGNGRGESFRHRFSPSTSDRTPLDYLGMTCLVPRRPPGKPSVSIGEADFGRANGHGTAMGSYANALFNRLLIGAPAGRGRKGSAPPPKRLGALAEEHGLKFWRAICVVLRRLGARAPGVSARRRCSAPALDGLRRSSGLGWKKRRLWGSACRGRTCRPGQRDEGAPTAVEARPRARGRDGFGHFCGSWLFAPARRRARRNRPRLKPPPPIARLSASPACTARAHSRFWRRSTLARLLPVDRRSGGGARRPRAGARRLFPDAEFLEIEEAQALLAALADTDEVKNVAGRVNGG